METFGCAHKTAAATAFIALASLVARTFELHEPPWSWSGCAQSPAGNSQEIDRMEKWLAQGIDTSALIRKPSQDM